MQPTCRFGPVAEGRRAEPTKPAVGPHREPSAPPPNERAALRRERLYGKPAPNATADKTAILSYISMPY